MRIGKRRRNPIRPTSTALCISPAVFGCPMASFMPRWCAPISKAISTGGCMDFPKPGFLTVLVRALIRSSDGDVMLVRQRPGNVNYGFAYLPAGFIDERDVHADGTVEIVSALPGKSPKRLGEVEQSPRAEMRALSLRDRVLRLSFAVPFRAPMTTAEFVRLVDEHNAMCADPELRCDCPGCGSLGDIEGLPMLAYARVAHRGAFRRALRALIRSKKSLATAKSLPHGAAACADVRTGRRQRGDGAQWRLPITSLTFSQSGRSAAIRSPSCSERTG